MTPLAFLNTRHGGYFSVVSENKIPSGSSEKQFTSEDLPLAPLPDGVDDSERYPDTRKWSEQQKAEYLEKNKPLIRSIVSKIKNIPDAALSQEDLFQEAQVAFWLAMDTYNPRKKTLFTTYAHKCMRNAVNEKLRATTASKRKPVIPTIPFDSGFSESGDEFMGGDNMEVPVSSVVWQAPPVEDQCIQSEILACVYKILRTQFNATEQHVFLALSQKQATQNELARELNCSQAKISMLYKFVRIRLYYELTNAGFTEM